MLCCWISGRIVTGTKLEGADEDQSPLGKSHLKRLNNKTPKNWLCKTIHHVSTQATLSGKKTIVSCLGLGLNTKSKKLAFNFLTTSSSLGNDSALDIRFKHQIKTFPYYTSRTSLLIQMHALARN